ncbi:MAG: zinc ribbon domain-containing protein, partial [Verrucomicrobiales bacterium]
MTETTAPPVKPAPHPTPISAHYWESLNEGKLTIQKCTACGSLQHYPRPFCLNCLSSDLEWERVSGRATLFSFTIVRRAASPA